MKKSRLLVLIFSITVCVCCLAFGVYAAYNAALSMNGTIMFEALGVDVDIDAYINGAVGTGITTSYQGTSNNKRAPSRNNISSSPFIFNNLKFDDVNAYSVDDLIIEFEFKIYNYSAFPIEGDIAVSSVANANIEIYPMDYSYSYDASLGADVRFIVVTIQPLTMESNIDLTDLTMTLTLEKTFKTETPADKFIWTTNSGEQILKGNNLLATDTRIIIPRYVNGNKVVGIYDSTKQVEGVVGPFMELSTLTNVTIPNSVVEIGNMAFALTNLKYIVIPNGVIRLGYGTFGQIESLKMVKMTDTVKDLGSATFIMCSFKTIRLSVNLTNLGMGTFGMNELLRNIEIPGGVKIIPFNCFYYCTNLIEVKLSEGVEIIDRVGFGMCINLKNVNLPTTLKTIEYAAFMQCENLVHISVPNGVTTIGDSAFGMSNITSINIPDSVTFMGGDVFKDTPLERNFVSGFNYMGKVLVRYVGTSPESITNIKTDTKSIAGNAFQNQSTLKTISIPTSVQSIGPSAFQNCGLNSVTIPNGVKLIGALAFKDCINLATITMADSVDEVRSQAFEGTSWLSSKPNGPVYIGKGLYTYKGTVSGIVTLDSTIKYIADYAFEFSSTLTSITLPASLINIGEGAFKRCRNLTTINLNTGLKKIGDFALQDIAISTITIPASVENLGNAAISDNINLASIFIARTTPFIYLGTEIFSVIKNPSTIYFKNSTVREQFKAFETYDSNNTNIAFY